MTKLIKTLGQWFTNARIKGKEKTGTGGHVMVTICGKVDGVIDRINLGYTISMWNPSANDSSQSYSGGSSRGKSSPISCLLGKVDQNVQGVDIAKLTYGSSQTDGYPLSSQGPSYSRQLPSSAATSYW